MFETEGVAPLSGVLTLGIYRELAHADAGRHLRELGDVGVLLHQAKYYRHDRSPLTRERSLSKLCDLLCTQISDHPRLRGAAILLGAPSSGSGFSEDLAQWVSDGSGLDLCMPTDQLPGGRPRKEAKVHRSYAVERPLDGQKVIVLDDVFDEGTTMRALGLAGSLAGARECVGLAIARKTR